jgi:hypothetical protein
MFHVDCHSLCSLQNIHGATFTICIWWMLYQSDRWHGFLSEPSYTNQIAYLGYSEPATCTLSTVCIHYLDGILLRTAFWFCYMLNIISVCICSFPWVVNWKRWWFVVFVAKVYVQMGAITTSSKKAILTTYPETRNWITLITFYPSNQTFFLSNPIPTHPTKKRISPTHPPLPSNQIHHWCQPTN